MAAACLLLAALTSATDVALVQISRQNIRQAAESDRRGIRSVGRLLERPRAYGSAMTVLHTVASTAFAVLLCDLVLRERIPGGLLTALLLATPLLLILGYSLPRALARRSIEATAASLARFAWVATALARPLVAIGDSVTRLFLRLTRRTGPIELSDPPTEGDLQAVIGTDYGAGLDDALEDAEREMIDAILDLEDHTARDIMVPRLDIVAVSEDAPLQEVVEVIQRAGHSRVPVYREAIDQIVGVLYAKDLLRFILRDAAPIPIAQIARPLDIVVPESKPVDELLREMRTRKVHLALVADEYGGTAGIVTIEDILEEIVGEIHDEHDPATAPLIEEISAGEYVFDARIGADEVSDLLALDWTEEEHNTLSGLVQRELGRVPAAGEELDYGGVHITVLSVDGHRLKRLHVERRTVTSGDQSEEDARAVDAAEVTK